MISRQTPCWYVKHHGARRKVLSLGCPAVPMSTSIGAVTPSEQEPGLVCCRRSTTSNLKSLNCKIRIASDSWNSEAPRDRLPRPDPTVFCLRVCQPTLTCQALALPGVLPDIRVFPTRLVGNRTGQCADGGWKPPTIPHPDVRVFVEVPPHRTGISPRGHQNAAAAPGCHVRHSV